MHRRSIAVPRSRKLARASSQANASQVNPFAQIRTGKKDEGGHEEMDVDSQEPESEAPLPGCINKFKPSLSMMDSLATSEPATNNQVYTESTQSLQPHLTNPNPSTLATTPAEDKPRVGFHFFSKLPTELQLKVWKFALPAPRIVQLRLVANPKEQTQYPLSKQRQSSSDTPDKVPSQKRQSHYYIQADINLSPLLATCKRSRQIMLEHYNHCVESKGDWKLYIDAEEDWVILNDTVMSILFNGDTRMHSVVQDALKGLKKLVVSSDLTMSESPPSDYGPRILGIFRAVDYLVLYTESAKVLKNGPTWANENLCLLRNEEFYEEEMMTSDEAAIMDSWREEQKKFGRLRKEIKKVGGRAPYIEHRWLYPRWDELEENADDWE